MAGKKNPQAARPLAAATIPMPHEEYCDSYLDLEESVCDVEAWASILCDFIDDASPPAGLSREERMVFEHISRLGDALRRAVDNLTESYRGRSRHAIAEEADRAPAEKIKAAA
jgi:hypothetical protein